MHLKLCLYYLPRECVCVVINRLYLITHNYQVDPVLQNLITTIIVKKGCDFRSLLTFLSYLIYKLEPYFTLKSRRLGNFLLRFIVNSHCQLPVSVPDPVKRVQHCDLLVKPETTPTTANTLA